MVNPAKVLKGRLYDRVRPLVRRWAAEPNVDLSGRRLDMSPLSYATPNVVAFNDAEDLQVRVGKYSSVQHTVEILVGGGHHVEWVSTYPFRVMRDTPFPPEPGDVPVTRGPVVIGNDAYIGWRATILSGVTIGDGAVVGAQAVVARDVEPYSIVVGNPAQHVRYRFDEPQRAALLRIAWWDWPDELVVAHADQLCDADIAGFISRHDPAGATEACGTCTRPR